jgi:hypothetical protein
MYRFTKFLADHIFLQNRDRKNIKKSRAMEQRGESLATAAAAASGSAAWMAACQFQRMQRWVLGDT